MNLDRACAEVLEDCAKRNGSALPPEQQSIVMQHAADQQVLKQHGTRPTNKSAAMDAAFTAARIQSEVSYMAISTLMKYIEINLSLRS